MGKGSPKLPTIQANGNQRLDPLNSMKTQLTKHVFLFPLLQNCFALVFSHAEDCKKLNYCCHSNLSNSHDSELVVHPCFDWPRSHRHRLLCKNTDGSQTADTGRGETKDRLHEGNANNNSTLCQRLANAAVRFPNCSPSSWDDSRP